MRRKHLHRCLRLCPALLVPALAAPLGAETVTLGFDDLSPGRVVAGETPSGGTAASDLFAYVTLSVVNSGGGPNSLVVFDSSDPSGEDFDLGSPNLSFGGPGVGFGGTAGQPGENATALGHVLVIGDDIEDSTPEDGLVDDPGDEAGGGLITATFEVPVQVDGVTLLDMDGSSDGSWIRLYEDDALLWEYDIPVLGDNSVQRVDLSAYDAVTRLEVHFEGPGALDDLEFRINPVAVEPTTWGGLKNEFR